MYLLLRWLINTVALFLLVQFVPGFHADSWVTLAVAALVLGLLNAIVKPILFILTLPLTIVTLGLFLLVINALMLKVVSEIVPCFQVHGFWRAVIGAIIISLISWLLSAFFRGSDGRVHVLTHHTQIKHVRGRVIEPGE